MLFFAFLGVSSPRSLFLVDMYLYFAYFFLPVRLPPRVCLANFGTAG
jgi:hypothetical protein